MEQNASEGCLRAVAALVLAASGTVLAAPSPGGDARSVASPRLERLLASVAAGDAAAVAAFWAETGRDGAPLVEPTSAAGERLVTFLWRSGAETRVVVLTDFGDYIPHMTLARLPGTDGVGADASTAR